MSKNRELYFFKDFFERFYNDQTEKVQRKILWTLIVIEEIDRIPEVFLKHIKIHRDSMKSEFKLVATFIEFSVSST
jgi:hypothetical protein